MPKKNIRGFKVRALGEIAIRCLDLSAMCKFYEDIIGLKRLDGNSTKGIVFFKIAKGYDGHTTVLALFSAELNPDTKKSSTKLSTLAGQESSLHHLALTVPYSEQDAAVKWYEENGLDYEIVLFNWVGWRGIFTKDPEGNTVELVAFDKTILATSSV